MFRNLTMAIFRLRNEKNLISSYTRLMWAVYSGEVRGEVGTISRMCYVGWAVWVHGGSAIICYVSVIWLYLRYRLMFVEIICTYIIKL